MMIKLLRFSDLYSWQFPKKTITVWVQYPGQAREIFHQDILTPELYEYEENPKEKRIADPILNSIEASIKLAGRCYPPTKRAQAPYPQTPNQKGPNPQP